MNGSLFIQISLLLNFLFSIYFCQDSVEIWLSYIYILFRSLPIIINSYLRDNGLLHGRKDQITSDKKKIKTVKNFLLRLEAVLKDLSHFIVFFKHSLTAAASAID